MEQAPTTSVSGEYGDATVFLPESEMESNIREQLQEMVNTPAINGDVRVMPDTHVGSGAVIGFTMPLSNKVVPNVVGVDIGCGMEAVKLSGSDLSLETEKDRVDVDNKIRNAVPMGRNVHSFNETDYHLGNQFPWDEFSQKWETLATEHLPSDIRLGEYHPDEFSPDIEYYKELTSKVGYDVSRGIKSVGTLGGGNHFIELGTDSSGHIWCTIHSGSRGLGMAIAEYHQKQAARYRNADTTRENLKSVPDNYHQYLKFDIDSVSDYDLLTWVTGGKGESFIDYEALRDDYEDADPDEIQRIGNTLKDAVPDDTKGNALDYLQGEEAVEYLVDLAFGQTYALENRRRMSQLVADALEVDIGDRITSVHNYIDYNDGIIRKGATPARDGERGIVPLNMSDGVLLVEGKGNSRWNQSCPHGAGRVMSRSEAFDTLSESDFKQRMGDTTATELPLDEAPMAYKDAALIRSLIEPTADIIDTVVPKLSIKAPN